MNRSKKAVEAHTHVDGVERREKEIEKMECMKEIRYRDEISS